MNTRCTRWSGPVRLFVLCLIAAPTSAHGDVSSLHHARYASAGSPSSEAINGRRPLSPEDARRVAVYGNISLSPDGTWLAYEYSDPANDNWRIRLEKIGTARTIELAPQGASASRATWSPDSQHLAFASDSGGAQSLWIWDRASETARRIAGAEFADRIASARWFPDSRRVLVPLWPEGVQRPERRRTPEALSPFRPPYPPARPGEPSVFVLRANIGATEPADQPRRQIDPDYQKSKFPGADLAIVDVRNGDVERIVHRAQLRQFHQPSPDGQSVAYIVWRARERESQLDTYDLHLVDVASHQDRILASNIHDDQGFGLSWSPDSQFLAHVELRRGSDGVNEQRRTAAADLLLITIRDGEIRALHPADAPALYGRERAIWSKDGARLYARTVDGGLWEVDVPSGQGRVISRFDGLNLNTVIRPRGRDVLWSPHNDRRILVAAERPERSTAGIYQLDLRTGAVSPIFERSQDITQHYVDASEQTGSVVLVTSNQQSPSDLWLWNSRAPEATKIGSLNRFLDGVALGEARRIYWRSADGRNLAGALLLPPGYRRGERLPLFVWVYGGRMGSEDLNHFGFGSGSTSFSAASNMQILASRGYAVLAPDAPQRVGTPMRDLFATVMPGVDAAIAQGFVDPDRLAIGGHSYGSYSTLAIITQTTRFRAAIIRSVGDPNLFANYLEMQGNGNARYYWAEIGQGLMGGTPWKFPDRYRENSPIFSFDRIETPLLIAQGDLDPSTMMTGANSVFVALRRLGKPVEYRIYEGEGHNLSRPENVMDFWNRALEFLAENLDIALDGQGRVIMENSRAKSRSPAPASPAQPH